MFEQLLIISPKQSRSSLRGWDAFFPYYAGYPTSFASSLIGSAHLHPDAVILDPWNGSGTTTQVAAQLGHRAIGCDLNPVMVIVSRARCLHTTEGDSISPLTRKILAQAKKRHCVVEKNDPLLGWFDARSAACVRSLEAAIRKHLLGVWTLRKDGTHFECMSSLAATFYVALFRTCRSFLSKFQSSNPTWLRRRRSDEAPISADEDSICRYFKGCLEAMSDQLNTEYSQATLNLREPGTIDTRLADSTNLNLPASSVDFVLTSPPYCTRIDYTAATRIELAVLEPLLDRSPGEISRLMIGSTRVPLEPVTPSLQWGKTCIAFLDSVRNHRSKASDGYYLKTHLDYFSKLHASINQVKTSMRSGAIAVFVVQDSYYKEVHNNLPLIVTEMGTLIGLRSLGSREFRLSRSMSGINPHTKLYSRRTGAVESVIGFRCA